MAYSSVPAKAHAERFRIWQRFKHSLDSGHNTYTHEAKQLEDTYLGAGRQWAQNPEIQQELNSAGKPTQEVNLTQSSIRIITGYQTQSRMHIAYQPREDGDDKTAEVLTKMALYELDRNRFPWLESDVFTDGLVQRRGYFNIEMDYTNDLNGEIAISSINPLDVIPDPNAKAYDPKDWNEVTVMKWIPVSRVKTHWPKAYNKVLMSLSTYENDWGQAGDGGAPRNSFAEPFSYLNYYMDDQGDQYVRVLEHQYRKAVRRDFFMDPDTQELTPVPDTMGKKVARKHASSVGQEVISRVVTRIRYHISTEHATLHDDWSPYDFLTVVPYFPIFRRGVTLGLVDNLSSNQDMMNKLISQLIHVVNTTANSGWMHEEGSLANMDDEDLAEEGGATGLSLVYKRGRPKPEKIPPNPVPTGLKDLFGTLRGLHDQILGVTEAFRGEHSSEVSGQAIQRRVQQTAVGLTSIIDNLFRTRNILAGHLLSLFQSFYTEQRVFNIISGGKPERVVANEQVEEEDEYGEVVTAIVNDVTLGKYDVVISDVPTQVTYMDAQLQQALELKKFGVGLPDDEVVRMTTLTRKEEIAKKLSGEGDKAAQEKNAIENAQLKAQLTEMRAKAENTEHDTIKKAAEVAKLIADNPNVAPILEQVLAMDDPSTTDEEPPEQTEQTPIEAPQQPPGQGFGGIPI